MCLPGKKTNKWLASFLNWYLYVVTYTHDVTMDYTNKIRIVHAYTFWASHKQLGGSYSDFK